MSPEMLFIVAGTAALVLRALCASRLRADERAVTRLVAAGLSAFGAWLLVSAAGYWTPWWPVIPVAAAGAVPVLAAREQWWRPLYDAAAVTVFGMLAVPPAAPLAGAAMALAYAGWGLCADRAFGRRPRRWQPPLLIGAAILVLAGGAGLFAMSHGKAFVELRSFAGMGLLHADGAGEPIRLPSGGAAWLRTSEGGQPALLLHGAATAGSRQPAAGPLREALRAAGYSVLSLDHPGYGLTPPPDVTAPVHVWDPLSNILEALEYLDTRFAGQPVLVVGHSMGTKDALRALRNEPRVQAALLFGGALPDPADRDRYWYGRFHTDRRLGDTMPFDKWLEIRDLYYDAGTSAQALPPTHAPVVFVRFEHEHENLAASRDSLFELIPSPKRLVDFSGVTHYFNASAQYGGLGVFLADADSARRLARHIRDWLAPERPAATRDTTEEI